MHFKRRLPPLSRTVRRCFCKLQAPLSFQECAECEKLCCWNLCTCAYRFCMGDYSGQYLHMAPTKRVIHINAAKWSNRMNLLVLSREGRSDWTRPLCTPLTNRSLLAKAKHTQEMAAQPAPKASIATIPTRPRPPSGPSRPPFPETNPVCRRTRYLAPGTRNGNSRTKGECGLARVSVGQSKAGRPAELAFQP